MIVLTHDLDFGSILAATRQPRPSVVQIRTANLRPETIGQQVIESLKQMGTELEAGALLTITLSKPGCDFYRSDPVS